MRSEVREYRIPRRDEEAHDAAQARQEQLIKPRGSLGRLEGLAVEIAAMTRGDLARTWPPAILVFAADHGVAARGVSAYPSDVTGQMVHAYLGGMAAINVLTRMLGTELFVVDVGVGHELPEHPALCSAAIRRGTGDFLEGPAMSRHEAVAAIAAGESAVREVARAGAGSVAVGDMGIGNTTAASAISAALLGVDAERVTGRGSGVDDAGWRHKVDVVRRALTLHDPDADDPVAVLAAVGGLEIAAITGAILEAAERRMPVVLDGFITGAAALAAVAIAPAAGDYLIASHRSAEAGHATVLEELGLEPLLDLGLRLGEASGAALALPLVHAAILLHTEMATFAEAGVAEEG